MAKKPLILLAKRSFAQNIAFSMGYILRIETMS